MLLQQQVVARKYLMSAQKWQSSSTQSAQGVF
jgi:hypothetical protein